MDFRRYMEYMSVSPLGVLQSLVVGLVVGFLTYVGYLGMQQFAFDPIFCRDSGSSMCSNVPVFSVVLSTIIFHFLGLVALVRIGIIRPLLIVLATIITVYGFHVWLDGMAWWIGSLYTAMLVGFSYLYYTWINRMTAFPVALGLTIVSVAVVRLLLAYW